MKRSRKRERERERDGGGGEREEERDERNCTGHAGCYSQNETLKGEVSLNNNVDWVSRKQFYKLQMARRKCSS